MASRPPPFAGLRVLEAACRHRSYSQAGQELGVTHSAVSQTIRRLEDSYQLKLFPPAGHADGPNPVGALASPAPMSKRLGSSSARA